MIPVFQRWQRANEMLELEKNHRGGGYFVDVQGVKETKEALKTNVEMTGGVSCQWNSGSDLSMCNGPVLTIRTNTLNIGGDQLLDIVSQQLRLLGFVKKDKVR